MILLAIYIHCNIAYAVISGCPSTSTIQNIANGKKYTTFCLLCGSVPSGCPCSRSCDYTSKATCQCNAGFHSYDTTITENIINCACTENCESGYYGDGETCIKCPSPGTSNHLATNLEINNCYIPTNQEQNDGTGVYVYSTDCYYTESDSQ